MQYSDLKREKNRSNSLVPNFVALSMKSMNHLENPYHIILDRALCEYDVFFAAMRHFSNMADDTKKKRKKVRF